MIIYDYIYDDIWWYMIIYDYLWLYMIIYDYIYIWWYMIIYDDIWWYMIIYDDIWWYMIIYDGIWWYMIMFDYIWLFYMILVYILRTWWFSHIHIHTHQEVRWSSENVVEHKVIRESSQTPPILEILIVFMLSGGYAGAKELCVSYDMIVYWSRYKVGPPR